MCRRKHFCERPFWNNLIITTLSPGVGQEFSSTRLLTGEWMDSEELWSVRYFWPTNPIILRTFLVYI